MQQLEHALVVHILSILSLAIASVAAANVRCLIRSSTLRAVPVFLPPARCDARRSLASHTVFHGLGDTKLLQTGLRTHRP